MRTRARSWRVLDNSRKYLFRTSFSIPQPCSEPTGISTRAWSLAPATLLLSLHRIYRRHRSTACAIHTPGIDPFPLSSHTRSTFPYVSISLKSPSHVHEYQGCLSVCAPWLVYARLLGPTGMMCIDSVRPMLSSRGRVERS